MHMLSTVRLNIPLLLFKEESTRGDDLIKEKELCK